MRCHSHLGAIGQDETGDVAELFDRAEDIVPASAVQTGRMFPQFVQYLIHLKCCQDSLDEHCSSDGAAWNTQFILSEYKDIIPEAGLQVILQFGQVEVGASTSLQQ